MKLFLSPHNDDECLWGSFTLIREKPQVVIVFDGYAQANRGHAEILPLARRQETLRALEVLGINSLEDTRQGLGVSSKVHFLGLRDDAPATPDDVLFRLRSYIDIDKIIDEVYSPIYHEDGHHQHNIVSRAADLLKVHKHVKYATYTRNGGKQRTEFPVTPLDGDWIQRKHLAIACYKSQYTMKSPAIGCWPWFMSDLNEYTA